MHLCGAGHVCMYRGGVGPVGDERTTTARYKSRMQPHFDTDMIFLVDVGCARQQAGSCTHDELRHRHTYRHKRGFPPAFNFWRAFCIRGAEQMAIII